MTPDQLAIAFLFTFLLGGYIGRVLTLDQQARKTVECMTALINSEWWGPAAKVAELHRDQDVTGDLPRRRIPEIKVPPLPAWVGNIYDRKRWREPKVRRAR